MANPILKVVVKEKELSYKFGRNTDGVSKHNGQWKDVEIALGYLLNKLSPSKIVIKNETEIPIHYPYSTIKK